MYRLIFAAALWSFSTVNLLAQENETSILNSNRIGFTESSRTVMKGGFLLEGGLQYSHYKFAVYPKEGYTTNTISGPRLRLSYGITNFMEIQGEGNYSIWNFNSDSGYQNRNESAKYSLGLKFNLTKQKGMLPQTALSISEKYYTGIGFNPFFKTTANLAWSYNLGKHFNLSGNILYSRTEGDYNGLGLGLQLGYNFNDNIGLFIEWYLYDQFVDFSIINIGAWYKVSPRFLVSLNVGTDKVTKYDWEGGNNSFSATLGVSFLLNNPKKKAKKRR